MNTLHLQSVLNRLAWQRRDKIKPGFSVLDIIIEYIDKSTIATKYLKIDIKLLIKKQIFLLKTSL